MDGWRLLERLGTAGEAFVAFDDDGAAAELGEGSFIGLALDEDEVAAAVIEARVEKAIFEGLLVGEQEEAFGVHVEPAQREALGREVVFLESALSFIAGVGVELAEDAVGFVEGDEHLDKAGKGLRLKTQRKRGKGFFEGKKRRRVYRRASSP